MVGPRVPSLARVRTSIPSNVNHAKTAFPRFIHADIGRAHEAA